MYITKIILNPYFSATQRLLSNRHFLHGAVEACFNEGKEVRKLWRLSLKGKDPELFIISHAKPDAKHFLENYSRNVETSVQIKDYSGMVKGVEVGAKYRLQIEVNPVKMKPRTRGFIPLISEEDITEWIKRHATNNGFTILGEVIQVKNPDIIIQKGKHKINARTVQIDGVIQVDNLEKFQSFLMNGIGQKKSYGFGMPMVAPL